MGPRSIASLSVFLPFILLFSIAKKQHGFETSVICGWEIESRFTGNSFGYGVNRCDGQVVQCLFIRLDQKQMSKAVVVSRHVAAELVDRTVCTWKPKQVWSWERVQSCV